MTMISSGKFIEFERKTTTLLAVLTFSSLRVVFGSSVGKRMGNGAHPIINSDNNKY